MSSESFKIILKESDFTDNQIALIKLIQKGLDNQEIAKELDRSEETIKNRIWKLDKKLSKLYKDMIVLKEIGLLSGEIIMISDIRELRSMIQED